MPRHDRLHLCNSFGSLLCTWCGIHSQNTTLTLSNKLHMALLGWWMAATTALPAE